MDTILMLIQVQVGTGLSVAALAYVAFAGIMAIGAWSALRK